MPDVKKKLCVECSAAIVGRVDKKFCSDQCRSAYNNKRHAEDHYVKDVNRILRKNRRILTELNPEGKCKVTREKMNAKGFDFTYYTSVYTTKEGGRYIYCYDQGYLKLENDIFLLVVRKNTAY